MRNATIGIFLLLFLVGTVFLQIFLSKRKSKWFGLIIPIITFIYSLLMIFGFLGFNGMTGKEILITVVITFLIGNIPTVILLGIYFGCREKMKIKTQIEKMNIQDLD